MILLELLAYVLALAIGMNVANFPEENWMRACRRANRVMVAVTVAAILLMAGFLVISTVTGNVMFRRIAVAPLAASGTAWLLTVAGRLRRLGGNHTGRVAGIYRGADMVPGKYGGSAAELHVLYEPFFEYFYDNSVYCTASLELYSRDTLMRLFLPGREYVVWVDPASPWDFQCFPYAERGRRCARVAAVYLVVAVAAGFLP